MERQSQTWRDREIEIETQSDQEQQKQGIGAWRAGGGGELSGISRKEPLFRPTSEGPQHLAKVGEAFTEEAKTALPRML